MVPWDSMAYWWIIFLQAGLLCNADAQFFDRFLTIRNIYEPLNASGRSLLLCSPTQDNPNGTSIIRAMDTGQGISLPNKTDLVPHPPPYHMLTAYLLPNPANPIDVRFGAYTCEETVGNVTTRATTFKLPFAIKADVIAPHRYMRANIGERVELKVNAVSQPLALQWKHNGEARPEWENLTEVVIDAVTTNDSGIYECFYEGRQSLGLHALIHLIIRGCPPNKWGESCSQDCPSCFNGGVCNAELGVCICPPGFDGDLCELPCDPNSFGKDCEKLCDQDETASPEDACAAFLFCLPEPYGCSCGSGFKGDLCYEDCDGEGTYGAGCTQECHCKGGPDACNFITGECYGGCAFGWIGESCQISVSNPDEFYNASGVAFECPVGHFGFPYCNESCHCAPGNTCDASTGICPSGCAERWNGSTCSDCVMGMFGPNCDSICHCELGIAACNSTNGICNGGCGPGYVGESCQEECPQSRYGSNCSSICFCQHGGRCNPVSGTCECVGKWHGDSCDESTPEILLAENVESNVGAEANITCLVWSLPSADVQISTFDFPLLITEVVQLNKSMQLAHTQLQLSDASSKTFNCSATNHYGTTMTTLSLTAIAPPVLSSPPIIVGQTSDSLEVKWDAWQWGKDTGGKPGDSVQYKVMVRYETDSDWIDFYNWMDVTSMRIVGVFPSTTYQFAIQCRRQGLGGAGEPGPYITVVTPCLPNQEDIIWPTDLHDEEVGTNHVHLRWTEPSEIDLLCPIQKYVLRFWPKERLELKGPPLEISGGQNHYLLDGLKSGTVYVVELSVMAENVVVGRPASISVTPHTAMTGPVEGLQSEIVLTSTEAHISWHEPITKQAAIINYLVNFQLMDRGKCGHKHASPPSDVEVGETEIVLSMLHPFSMYEVNVQPLTPLGSGEMASINITTNTGIPTSAPADVRIFIVAPTSLGFRWAAIPCNESNGIVTNYEYTLTKANYSKMARWKRSTAAFYQSELISDNQTEVIIQNLKSNEVYEFMVRGHTTAGSGPWSDVTSERTLVDLPSSPSLLVLKTTSTNVIVDIRRPSNTSSAIKAYQLTWSTGDGRTKSFHIGKPMDPAAFNYTVPDLEPTTCYELTVKARSLGGWSNQSASIVVCTEDEPPGPPRELELVDASAWTLVISWHPPYPLQGSLTGYKVRYQLAATLEGVSSKNGQSTLKEIKLNSNMTTRLALTSLEPLSEYEVSVVAYSEFGESSPLKKIFATLPENAAPGPPRELELVDASAWTLVISWHPPYPLQGSLTGYKVRYQLAATLEGVSSKNGQSTLKEIKLNSNMTTRLALTSLEPLSEYEVSVVAYSELGESSPLKKIFATLSESAVPLRLPPPPPMRVNSSDVSTETASVLMFPVQRDLELVRSYQLVVEDVELNNEVIHSNVLENYLAAMKKNRWFYIAAEIAASNVNSSGYPFQVGDNKTYGGYINAPLQPSHLYKLRLRSVGVDLKMVQGFSTMTAAQELVRTRKLTADLNVAGSEPHTQDECMGLGLSCFWFLIIIIALTLMVILFLILILCTRWRKHSHGSHRIRQPSSKHWENNDKKEKSSVKMSHLSSSRTYSVSYSVSEAEVNAENGPIVCGAHIPCDTKANENINRRKTWANRSSEPSAIPVPKLSDYIHAKNMHSTYNFQEEFKQLLSGQTGTWMEAKKPENTKKNRYGNILPYDHTRVCLQPLAHVLHSDYINASYIDGYRKKRAYIAAQGPKENYFADFWRMIWQVDAAAIVMVTSLIEMGRVKCDQYWPNDSCVYGDLHVTITEIQTAVDTIIRLFLLQKISTGEIRRVSHYQLLDWPDQSAPMYASPLLSLRQRLLREIPDDSGPIVVHCSAGIGRTGTFMAIDALLHQADEEGLVDVFSYVSKMRFQRINMVQTLEQYIFIYDTLLQALVCKDTKVMVPLLSAYLKDIKGSENSSILREQFMKLAQVRNQMDWHHCSEALNEINLNKNRDLAVLPSNMRRVRLSTLHRCCSSDYINAVSCDGYKLRHLFLSTQFPLPHTVEDFWAMVSSYQSAVIVVLHGTGMKAGLTNCGEYWPTEGCCHYGRYQVQVVTFQRRELYVEQNLKLIDEQAAANAQPQRIVQLQFTGDWIDEDNVPSSPAAMATLIHTAEAWNRRLGGPITVLCMDGASRCGLFCVGSVLSEQLRVEGAVDVFQVVRRMQKHQPTMIATPEQYRFCYELALALVE